MNSVVSRGSALVGPRLSVVRRYTFGVRHLLTIALTLSGLSALSASYVVSGFSRTVDSVASGFRLRAPGEEGALGRTAVALAEAVSRTDAASFQPAASSLPELTEPVNDLAHVIDADNAAAIERMIRTLKAATGDVVVVATVPTIEPYADIREYANKLFENHGRGIGEKDKDNGALILMAVKERRVWIEVGYALEQWITDGFAGETSRQHMAPEFREGRYGDGLRIGTERIIGRIAQGRGVTLEGVRIPREQPAGGGSVSLGTVIFIFALVLVLSRLGAGSRRGFNRWGGGGWSGWSSGVGPFGGGGWGGGGGGEGGGGFGGGFGGFGGGSSGGGGGGSSW